jgi:hypothetical protein
VPSHRGTGFGIFLATSRLCFETGAQFSESGCPLSTSRRRLRPATSTRRPCSTFPTVSRFPRAATLRLCESPSASVSSRRDNRKLASHNAAGHPPEKSSRPERTAERFARTFPRCLRDMIHYCFNQAQSLRGWLVPIVPSAQRSAPLRLRVETDPRLFGLRKRHRRCVLPAHSKTFRALRRSPPSSRRDIPTFIE